MSSLALRLSLVIILAPWPAMGEEGDRDVARNHANQGRELYEQGQHEAALEQYQAAYEIAPVAAVLFNIGQCHRHLGNCERALVFYQGYLRDAPDAPNRTAVEELISRCQEELAQVPDEPDEPPAVEDPQEPPDVEDPQETPLEGSGPLNSGEEATGQTPVQEPSVPTPVRPVYRRWWFWTIVGVVVVGAATSAALVVTLDEPTVVQPSGSLSTLDERQWQPLR